MFTTSAYACDDGSAPMKLATIKRRDPGPRDVEIEIEFCGVCHSDIHTARSEWPGSLYPCVPGHEIIGRVGRVGSQVVHKWARRKSRSRLWPSASFPDARPLPAR